MNFGMNTGIWLLAAYAVLLLGMGLLTLRDTTRLTDHKKRSAAFFVNGRHCGASGVALSIIASCVGGSATIGMAGLAWSAGTPAFWWMGSAACGLAVLVFFLAPKIRQSKAFTLPEMIENCMGRHTRRLVACIILLAWPAILAAQFLALGNICAALTGLPPQQTMVAGACLLIFYAAAGGQAAVIRGDMAQFALIATGLILAFLALFYINPIPVLHAPLQGVNESFPPSRLLYYMVVMGGSYVICPMLFGRFLSARDDKAAQRGGWLAVLGLALFGALVVALGLACRGLVPGATAPDDVLVTALNLLPNTLSLLLLLALFGAVLSSADSCLLTAATVCCNDVLRTPSLRACRLAVPVVGLAGLALALTGGDILRFLLMANDVYVCGVVAPVFVALIAYPRARPQHAFAFTAVALGGTLGLMAAFTGHAGYSYTGVAASALLCTLGVLLNTRRRVKNPGQGFRAIE